MAGMVPCEPIGLDYFQSAPHRFSYEVVLPVPPKRVFEIFEDEHSWPKWVHGMQRVEWTTPRPFGAGTERIVELAGNIRALERFFVWENDRHMAFYFVEASRAIWRSFAEDYQLEDLGDGRTRFRWTVAYEMRGLMRWLHPLMLPSMRRSFQGVVDGLAAYVSELERGGAPGSR